MKSRRDLIITAFTACHLLVAPLLLTSQITKATPSPAPPPQSASVGAEFSLGTEPITIQAGRQEKTGETYKLSGDVEIEFRDFIIRADQITYDKESGELTAQGHLRFDGGDFDQHIEADHGRYNTKTETGEFYQVSGSTGARFRGKNVTLTTSSPFTFSGEKLEKTGPRTFVLHHGSITSCELPQPKWTFNAAKITFEIGRDATIINSTFRLRGIPILFLPYAQHPVERIGRKSGFLVPSFGQSSRKGTIVGDAVYLALGRSADATIGAEYYSKRGYAQHGTFRVRPDEFSSVEVNYFGVLDRGVAPTGQDQGGEDVKLNAESLFAHGIRGVASGEYLSRYIFRLAFTETFAQAVNSEVRSTAFLSKTHRGFSFNAFASRYQNFQSTTPGDLVTILHAPGLNVSSVDRFFGSSRLMVGFDSSAEGISRSNPGFRTANLVGRFDARPRLSLPLYLRGWTIRPEVAARNTLYSQRLNATGTGVISSAINRRDIEASFEMRPPTLVRLFSKPVLGHKVKHAFEPRFTYRYVNGIENFQRIIRFDSQDTLSDTSELEYALVNRLYFKRANESDCEKKMEPGEVCNRSAREVVSWEVAQKYFFNQDFGGAVVTGRRNALATTEAFTGIAFLTDPRVFSPVISRLRVHASNNTELSWAVDYDPKKGQLTSSNVLLDHHVGDFFFGGSHTLLKTPGEVVAANSTVPVPDKFNQFRIILGYGNPSKRGLSVAGNAGFDSNLNFLQYAATQTSYNWDCCGVSFEYRRFALGQVRNENQYRFAFSLANIGTFGNLKRQERLF
jgi:LPS-assembly protein